MAGEPGVVVARSLTKLFGLPGLRAGFAVATSREQSDWRRRDARGILAGRPRRWRAHCLRDAAFVAETRDRVASERERVRERLPADVTGRPGVAPFVLCDVGDRDQSTSSLAVASTASWSGTRRRSATWTRIVRVAVRERRRTTSCWPRSRRWSTMTDADDGGWGDDDGGGWGDDGEDGGRRRRRQAMAEAAIDREPTSSEPFFDATRRDSVLELALERWPSGCRRVARRSDACGRRLQLYGARNWRCDDVAGFVRERLDEAGFAESGVASRMPGAPDGRRDGARSRCTRRAGGGVRDRWRLESAALPTEPAGGDLPGRRVRRGDGERRRQDDARRQRRGRSRTSSRSRRKPVRRRSSRVGVPGTTSDAVVVASDPDGDPATFSGVRPASVRRRERASARRSTPHSTPATARQTVTMWDTATAGRPAQRLRGRPVRRQHGRPRGRVRTLSRSRCGALTVGRVGDVGEDATPEKPATSTTQSQDSGASRQLSPTLIGVGCSNLGRNI